MSSSTKCKISLLPKNIGIKRSRSEQLMKHKIRLSIRRKQRQKRKCQITKEQLSNNNWQKIKTLTLTKELINQGVEVDGDKLDLVNLLRRSVYQLQPIDKNQQTEVKTMRQYRQTIYKFMLELSFYHLGNNKFRNQCNNVSDFETTQKITEIPAAYLYCLGEGNNHYGFDLRTLNNMIIRNRTTNPYSFQPISENSLQAIKRKLSLIKTLGFPIINNSNQVEINKLSPEAKFELYIEELVGHLYNLDYHIDSEWITELNFEDLKKLYAEIADIWVYRADIPDEVRKKIVKKGLIFSDAHMVKNMIFSQHNKFALLTKTLKNLQKMITDGETEEFRKLGAMYFMIGLSIVSDRVAEAYPYLRESSEAHNFE